MDNTMRLITREDRKWEQIAFAEVLVPNVPNVFGDYWTPEAVRQAAYMFMERGFQIDVEHDNVDVSDRVHVVETFVARTGDPDFIEGAWVVGVRITDAGMWQDVLDGKLNGFSYQALVQFVSAVLQSNDDGVRQGVTEPDPYDGHTHEFMVMVDEANRPVSGGTTETDGHAHVIRTHTVTEEAEGHVHRFNLVLGKDGK